MRPSSFVHLRALRLLVGTAATATALTFTLAACTVAGPSMVAGTNAKDGGATSNRDQVDPGNSDDNDPTPITSTTDPGTAPTAPWYPGSTGSPNASPTNVPDAAVRDAGSDARVVTTPVDAGQISQHLALVGEWHLTALTNENLTTLRKYGADGTYAETLDGVSRVGTFRNGDRDNHFVIEVHPFGQPTSTTKEYCTYAMTATKVQMSVICRAIGYSSNASVEITDAQPPTWTID